MAKEIPAVEEVKEERVVVSAYKTVRYNDGSVDVLDDSESFENVAPIENAAIYDDIEAVAELVAQKKAFNIAYQASHQYYQDLIRAQQQAAAQQAEEVAPVTE